MITMKYQPTEEEILTGNDMAIYTLLQCLLGTNTTHENIALRSMALKTWLMDRIQKSLDNRDNLYVLEFEIGARTMMAHPFWDGIIKEVIESGNSREVDVNFSNFVLSYLDLTYRLLSTRYMRIVTVEELTESDKMPVGDDFLNFCVALNYPLDEILNKVTAIISEKRARNEHAQKRSPHLRTLVDYIKIYEMKRQHYTYKKIASEMFPSVYKNDPLCTIDNVRKKYQRAKKKIWKFPITGTLRPPP